VSLYLAKYVAINFAFVPIYMTLINGITHVIGSLSLRRYNPGLYTLLFPGGILLLVYFNRIAPSAFQPARPACCRDRGLRPKTVAVQLFRPKDRQGDATADRDPC
jgi:hypothetical protein